MRKRSIYFTSVTVFFVYIFLFSLFSCKENTGSKIALDDQISEQEFLAPPSNFKPWVYYWWLKGNISRELITRDLEQMKEKGIGGFLLFDSRGYWDDYYGRTGHIPVPLNIKYEFMSPEWREMVKFTMQEANRLGLKMSINLANTGGSLRGPWDMKENGAKQLIWTGADITGPAKVEAQLKIPADKKYFNEMALIAVRIKQRENLLSRETAFDINGEWNTVTAPMSDAPEVLEIIDIKEKLNGENLQWDAPEGDWRIVRFGYHVIGEEGGVDILNSDAVTNYFHLMGSEILKDAGPLAGETLTHFYNVSWEGGQPDWTTGFDRLFKEYRGYAMNPYLPILSGLSMKDSSLNQRFMKDYLKTVSECFTENCYKTIGQLCHNRGIQWHSENGGPWPRQAPMFKEADQLVFWGANDMPQGEFWSDNLNNLEKKSNVRFTAMAAHTYGRPLVSVEAFTHMTNHWTMYPAYLKPFADVNFIDGANFFIWHTFTASPLEVGKPGYEYFAGTHINPNVTWFDKASGFFDYLGRCQYMLRKGNYVADICCYVSDKNYRKWGRGKEWNPNSTLKPVAGTSYELLSSEALVEQLSTKNGQLVLPHGMNYQLLVLDLEEPVIPVEVLQKVKQMVENGATLVLGEIIPLRSPGIDNHSKNDNEVKRLAKELWGNDNGLRKLHSLGKGKIYSGYNLEEVLTDMGIHPDFEGPYEYLHRKSAEQDIYFVYGEGKAECTFRVDGKKPEIWNPVTGKITMPAIYHSTDDGRMLVTLNLPGNGSAFIVFREKSDNNSIVNIEGPEIPEFISNESNSLQYIFWKEGEYHFTNSIGKSKDINCQSNPSFELSGSWKVLFEPANGTKKIEKTFEKLVLWNEQSEKEIKYFSGTATYLKYFNVTRAQADSPARLELEEVYNISRVWLNGQDLGILWTSSWTVNLGEYLVEGKNELKIEVTNCWANRLIGDAGLPENKRTVSTNVRLVSDRSEYQRGHQATSATDPLMPSGLAGQVIINFGQLHTITF